MVIEQHIERLGAVLEMTPRESSAHAEAVTIAVSKMTMVLAGRESGEFAAEAKGEAYMDALDDVPFWAVQEAMRKWHRSECGPKHDYKWQPMPATLRDIALTEQYRVMATRRRLGELIEAVPMREFSEEHCEMMKRRVEALAKGTFRTDEATGERIAPKEEDAA